MNQIHRKIREARPSLSKVSPLVFKIICGFMVVNLLLMAGMFYWEPTIYPVVAPNKTAINLWGAAFGLAGIMAAYGIKHNRWKLLRSTQTLGLFIKSMWLISLILRIGDGGTVLIAVVWGFLFYIQLITVIHFLPPGVTFDGRDTE